MATGTGTGTAGTGTTKEILKVKFIDGSSKTLALDCNTTIESFFRTIVERIGLQKKDCFSLFEKNEDFENYVDLNDKPTEIIKKWKNKDANYFLFKKRVFLLEDEEELQDPVARELIFKQAVYCVITGEYPFPAEDAIRLAAYQIIASDIAPRSLSNSLPNFVPQPVFSSRKPSEWEQLILRQHESLPTTVKEQAQLEYIKLAKNSPFYGMTFFACKSLNSRITPSKVIIGVNFEGIRIFKTKNKELMSEHLYTDISSWSSSASSQPIFAFEFGNLIDPTRYSFETKYAQAIAATIQMYIDILVKMLKNGDEEEQSEASATSETTEGAQ
eukprot:TRINITY_DN904_c0_g1_i1.p1 TRINITY_DN904_c0_g1~~TRINITY_DN904_c0_g1_i1.p1  ORF type:complete len:329 (+),score=153.09 TRINITY_DN904_c0_g1_i1:65-1051(+)